MCAIWHGDSNRACLQHPNMTRGIVVFLGGIVLVIGLRFWKTALGEEVGGCGW